MYKYIDDYGLIGDLHSLALVSKDGSLDYCSMPHLDSPTVFAALLDEKKGGFFRIQPKDTFEAVQEYIKDTNILSCKFSTKTGKAELIDFMSLSSQELFAPKDHLIHRCLRVISGEIGFNLELFPRPQYASEIPLIKRADNIFKFKGKKEVFSLRVNLDSYQVKENNSGLIIHFSLKKDQAAHFDFIYGDQDSAPDLNENDYCSFKATHKFWVDWTNHCLEKKCSLWGEYTEMINRSLLVLKLLTFQPTGAIAAAATTSLPEVIGGERNWDYRFSWIRDASFTLKALLALGHVSEADTFIRWLHTTYKKQGNKNLQIMYSLQGESRLKEKILDYLQGYKNSRPVRVGNDAYNQKQWDIYGEIMDTAIRLSDYAGRIDEELWPFFREICNLAVENWPEPDDGIWEFRNGPFHFVYSKVMCWVALDRGIKIARRYGFEAPLARWQKEAKEIKLEVLGKGYDKKLGHFVQYYGSKELDASLLLLPLVGFLPFDDPRIKNTIQACKKDLLKEGFLLRYSGADGLSGEEGGFLLCNFWLIECLALSGQIAEAKKLLELTVTSANHLGLFSEEFDFKNRYLLGNFPLAFSHIGYINAVSALLHVQNSKYRQEIPSPSLFKRIQKLIPLSLILNKTERKYSDTTREIGSQLKISLNNLQGAFFDVLESKVNYQAMKQSAHFQEYLKLAEKLNFFNPFILTNDAEKKAFWINIYNILIIHAVIELEISNSVREVFNFFRRPAYLIGGLSFTPDNIEHGILRRNNPGPNSKRREFSPSDRRNDLAITKFDPRIHFALVCASSSCPPIEFYAAENLDKQLDIAGRSFINRGGLLLEREKKIIYLSQIFKWYSKDFADQDGEILTFIIKFAEAGVREYIREEKNNLQISYLPYNWNLNQTL